MKLQAEISFQESSPAQLYSFSSRLPRLLLLLPFMWFLGIVPGPLSAQTDCSVQTDIPEAECQALLAIYNTMGGPGWNDNAGWGQTNSPCSWARVRCANSGHVRELTFLNAQLQGQLIPEFGDFPELRVLIISGNNSIFGPLPPELGDLGQLRRLLLQGEGLSGTIPSELADLINVVTLRFSYGGNCLTATDPTLIAWLESLLGPDWDRGQCVQILYDGFESGDLSAWSASVP